MGREFSAVANKQVGAFLAGPHLRLLNDVYSSESQNPSDLVLDLGFRFFRNTLSRVETLHDPVFQRGV